MSAQSIQPILHRPFPKALFQRLALFKSWTFLCASNFRQSQGNYDLRAIRFVGRSTRSQVLSMLWQFPYSLAGLEHGIFGWGFIDQVRHPSMPPGFDLTSIRRVDIKIVTLKCCLRTRVWVYICIHTGCSIFACSQPIAYALSLRSQPVFVGFPAQDAIEERTEDANKVVHRDSRNICFRNCQRRSMYRLWYLRYYSIDANIL